MVNSIDKRPNEGVVAQWCNPLTWNSIYQNSQAEWVRDAVIIMIILIHLSIVG